MSIRQAKGTTGVYDVTLRHETNVPLTYTGSETLIATVWPGDARAEVFAPSVVWVAAPNKVRVTVTPTNLSSVPVGTYRLRILCAGVSVAETDLIVEHSPGTEVAPLCYCTEDDLTTVFPGINQHKLPNERSGFEECRAAATEWLNEIILSRAADPITVKAWIDSGSLKITPRIKLCVAYKAVSLALQFRTSVPNGPDWDSIAAKNAQIANNSAISLTIELTNGVFIPLSSTMVRR